MATHHGYGLLLRRRPDFLPSANDATLRGAQLHDSSTSPSATVGAHRVSVRRLLHGDADVPLRLRPSQRMGRLSGHWLRARVVHRFPHPG